MKASLCILSVVVLAILTRPGTAVALPNENGEWPPDEVWWKTLILGWVEGFLSSYNFYGPGTSNISKGSDRDDIARWVDKYCLQHPGVIIRARLRLW